MSGAQLFSPLTSFFIPQLKTTSDSPKPARKMMMKLACLLGVLVCGSQGRGMRVRVRDSRLL